ncbi:hypothetical protein [Nocardia pseudobrasiliensis]|uniref:Low molecular weight antigen MTB12-like C-terminal domain-containing protein n=1 Tax=Nocardia pseudobrasiliensis TaxID=45979 RepID=A0A370IBN8_9NOCA|nr:hypothetical protein [Nocardia pseudobrasiliensis]RDI68138.1 hypothetical protein DFR76_102539 [Nocardia pseudobrasiliensis]
MRRTVTMLLFPVVAATVLTGCGGSKPSAAPESSTAAPADCTQGGKYPQSPTTELLQGLLRRGLDPTVAPADKVDLMQGGAGDPGFFDRMLTALNQANFAVTINGVTDYCNGTANADATLSFYGQPNNSQVPLIAEDGKWKLERVWACGLAASLQQTSPICV